MPPPAEVEAATVAIANEMIVCPMWDISERRASAFICNISTYSVSIRPET